MSVFHKGDFILISPLFFIFLPINQLVMSHLRIKTKYNEEGGVYYGSTETLDLYCHHNYSCDISTFYDEHGNWLFSVHTTAPTNLFEAIEKLMHPYKEKYGSELKDGIEEWSKEDREKLKS